MRAEGNARLAYSLVVRRMGIGCFLVGLLLIPVLHQVGRFGWVGGWVDWWVIERVAYPPTYSLSLPRSVFPSLVFSVSLPNLQS